MGQQKLCIKCNKRPALKNSSYCMEDQPKTGSGSDVYRMKDSSIVVKNDVGDLANRIIGFDKDKS